MKVILLKDVNKVGQKFDVKEVTSGYATNFLIPNSLAEIATKTKLIKAEQLRVQREEESKVQGELLAKNLDSLSKVSITIKAKANEKGSLFKGIHADEIVAELKEQAKVDISPSMISLQEPIKELGEVDIEVVFEGKNVKFKLVVVEGKE